MILISYRWCINTSLQNHETLQSQFKFFLAKIRFFLFIQYSTMYFSAQFDSIVKSQSLSIHSNIKTHKSHSKFYLLLSQVEQIINNPQFPTAGLESPLKRGLHILRIYGDSRGIEPPVVSHPGTDRFVVTYPR